MAEISTTETKRINVKIEAHWGTFKKSYASEKTDDILTIKFSYDVLKQKFSPFTFHRTKTGGWLGVKSLKELRVLHKAIGEAIKEVEQLSQPK